MPKTHPTKAEAAAIEAEQYSPNDPYGRTGPIPAIEASDGVVISVEEYNSLKATQEMVSAAALRKPSPFPPIDQALVDSYKADGLKALGRLHEIEDEIVALQNERAEVRDRASFIRRKLEAILFDGYPYLPQ